VITKQTVVVRVVRLNFLAFMMTHSMLYTVCGTKLKHTIFTVFRRNFNQ